MDKQIKKEFYTSPQVEVIEVEVGQMICISANGVTLNDVNSSNYGEI